MVKEPIQSEREKEKKSERKKGLKLQKRER
uniref:Uncharacterized protein n=1 Tax=Anguilla anguilla TaxID=7936 RepID=A0A0E9R306_ANGAN